MKTQEFINKVFELDIFPGDVYFAITRRYLILRMPKICFDYDENVYLYVYMKSRNVSTVYTDRLCSSGEELKELCDLVKQYADTPIEER